MSDMSTGRNGGDVYIAVQTQLKFTDNAFYGFQKKIIALGTFMESAYFRF